VCPEIGSVGLGGEARYDQLPVIAEHMGLPAHCGRMLWRDKAIAELDRAVLHSFTAAGVTIAAPGPHGDHGDAHQSPNFYRHPAPARITELFPENELAGQMARGLHAGTAAPPSLALAPALGMPKCRFLE
jgi:hypothetical protein